MPIVFYYEDASPSCAAVALTAEHLGIKLDRKFLDTDSGENMKPEFLKMNPAHTVPTIDDDGFILWESRAIMAYLINKYAPDSPLYPKDPKERAVVDKMMYFDIGTVYKSLFNTYFPAFYGKPKDEEKEKEFKAALSFLDKVLEKSPYVAGKHLTLADYSIISGLVFVEQFFDASYSEFPNVSAWIQKMKTESPKFKEIYEDHIKVYRKKCEQSK